MSVGCLGSVWEVSGGCLVDSIYFLVCNNVETIEKKLLCVIWISHGLFSQWPWKGKNWPKKGPWSIGRTHFRTKIRLNMVHMGQLGTENPMGLSRFQSWYHRGPPYAGFLLVRNGSLFVSPKVWVKSKYRWSSQWLCIGGGVNRPGEKLLKLGVTNASVSSHSAVHTRIWMLDGRVVTNMNVDTIKCLTKLTCLFLLYCLFTLTKIKTSEWFHFLEVLNSLRPAFRVWNISDIQPKEWWDNVATNGWGISQDIQCFFFKCV